MLARLAARSLCCLSWLALAQLLACKAEPGRPEEPPLLPSSRRAAIRPRAPAAANSHAVAFEKALQAQKLAPPPRPARAPVLAFGKGVLAQLGPDALRVFDDADFRLLATETLEAPRALLSLADGSLLAVGARSMLRWERYKKHPTRLPSPMLLPAAQLYPDSQRPDRLWVFDAEASGSARQFAGQLRSYTLAPSDAALLLPDQSIELTLPRGGAFGVTREGNWLYVVDGRAQRFGPSGLRLSGLSAIEPELPTWMLPARRVDQSVWVEESGRVFRVLVSPSYKRLSSQQLVGRVIDVDVGDEGQLVAAVLVTGEGPRFELQLLDQELAPLARVPLPGDEPTGNDDWARVVTENQGVVVAARKGRVVVGGPARLTIFDRQGQRLFSIPSR